MTDTRLTTKWRDRIAGPGSASSASTAGILLRHPVAVLITVTFFALLGLVLASLAGTAYEAKAELIVQDPRAPSDFEVADAQPSTQASERYLADQVRILESGIVASYVAEDLDMAVPDVSESLEIVGDLTSNLIEVRFTARSPEDAAMGANSVTDAYVRVVKEQARENANLALARIDALQEALDEKIASIEAEIQGQLTEDSTRAELEQQVTSGIEELNRLRAERDSMEPGTPARAGIVDRIAEVSADLGTWRLSLDLEAADPEMDALVAEQNDALTSRSLLDERRNTIQVDLELASANLALASPARLPDDPVGLSRVIIVAGLLLVGVFASLVVAYALDLRSRGWPGEQPGAGDPAPTEADLSTASQSGSWPGVAAASDEEDFEAVDRTAPRVRTYVGSGVAADLDREPTDDVEDLMDPDDLTDLYGISPKLARVLNDAGITTFADLAAESIAHLGEVLSAAGIQRAEHDPSTWPMQAKLATKGQWLTLKSFWPSQQPQRAEGRRGVPGSSNP